MHATSKKPSRNSGRWAAEFFGSMALTYYGRWSYKFEEAARREVRACFIIHTSETAGDRIVGLTPIGCGTVELLNMNDEDRRELRWAASQNGN